MDEGLLEKLKAAFRMEAAEYLELMRSALVGLPETGQEGKDAWLEQSFRAMHSLKGASRAVNQTKVERICMTAESLFARLREKALLPTEDEVEFLHEALLGIEQLVDDEESVTSEEVDKIVNALSRLGAKHGSPTAADNLQEPSEPEVTPEETKNQSPIPKPSTAKPEKSTNEPPRDPKGSGDGVRVSQGRLNRVMLEVEELTRVKLATQFQAERLETLAENSLKAKQASNGFDPILNRLEKIAADLDGAAGARVRKEVQKLWNQHEDMQVLLDPMEAMAETSRYEGVQQSLGTARIVDSLDDQLRGLLLMPFSEGLLVLGKMTRELSHRQSKLIDLKITGGSIEVDRRILEGVKDPFIHLIRNSVDHGIELPEEREKKNKPKRGTIEITVDHVSSGKISVTFSDDGRGLNLAGLRAQLIKEQRFSREELDAMDDAVLADTIFLSGISTATEVTEISGRGLGTSIVREKIEAIGGSIHIRDAGEKGTSFAIELPITQATFRGIRILMGKQEFVFPTRQVDSVHRVERSTIKTVKTKSTFIYQGQAMPIHPLAGIAGIESSASDDDDASIQVLVLQSGNRRLAVRVDEIIREQEILVKGLGPQLENVPHFSGVAITGMGHPALIFNTGEIINAASSSGIRPIQVEAPRSVAKPRKKRVLIAEDSFTSRMLLKNVLESASYEVEAAEDGAAAFATLKTGEFDALVSDVDMPRMNGFVLTERVRNDRRLGSIPIVLITSLATPEDKERGIDAGANAYIVKSNFDQGDLLATLERLMEAGNI